MAPKCRETITSIFRWNQAVKVKLDENVDPRGAALFRNSGFDVTTVKEEKLLGESDEIILGVCKSEARCLVTLDRGIGDPIKYNPSEFAGIAVIRTP